MKKIIVIVGMLLVVAVQASTTYDCFLLRDVDKVLAKHGIKRRFSREHEVKYQKPILFFDGECGFCDWSVRFIIARDSKRSFFYAPLQGSTAHELLPEEYTVKPYKSAVLYEDGTYYIASTAVLRVLKKLKAPWSWLYVFRVIPRSVRDIMYHILSNKRHLLMGKKEECAIPTQEERELFLP